MSNQIVVDGLSGSLLITDGWGFGASISAGKSILNFQQGNLLVDVEFFGGDAYLQFEDGINTIYQQLPFTADQKSGIDWAIIKLVRTGGNLKIVHDKTVVATIALTQVVTYGGTVKVMEENPDSIFDPRVINGLVSDEASNYYIEDLDENGGNVMLPNPEN